MTRRLLLAGCLICLLACARLTLPRPVSPGRPTATAVSALAATATLTPAVAATPTTSAAVTLSPSAPTDVTQAGLFIVMGDSWAAQMGLNLDPLLRVRGFTGRFVSVGAGGTDTGQWAADADGRLSRVLNLIHTQNARRPLLLIFLGGNDLLDGYLAYGDGILSQIDDNLRAVVAQLRAAGPGTTILISRFDFFSELCRTQLSRIGLTEPGPANAVLLQLGQIYAAIAAEEDNVIYLDLWGTLPGVGDSADRRQQWSDSRLYRDCVHPNAEGFQLIGAALLDKLSTSHE